MIELTCLPDYLHMISKFIKKLIPKQFHFRLLSYGQPFSKFRQIHYAQNCEDIMVQSLFPKTHKGFYVDVGAHHPYRISNTYLLHKQGWRGINIDANPDTINLFKKARPTDINLLLGVSGKAETLTYHTFQDPACNTFSDTEAERWKQKTWNKYLGATEVATQTLKDIFITNLPVGQTIDLLNVDVEGLDLEVLQSNNWLQFRPKVIIVEAHGFDVENMESSPIYLYLKQQGYYLRFVLKFSLIFSLPDMQST